MLEARRHIYAIREHFENMVQFGAYILIRLCPEKLTYFYIKNNYSNSFAMRLVIAPENFLKTRDN